MFEQSTNLHSSLPRSGEMQMIPGQSGEGYAFTKTMTAKCSRRVAVNGQYQPLARTSPQVQFHGCLEILAKVIGKRKSLRKGKLCRVQNVGVNQGMDYRRSIYYYSTFLL